MVILISDKINFKTTNIHRDKEGHFIMKGSVPWEVMTIINIYVHLITAPKYMKQLLTGTEGRNTHFTSNGDFSTALLIFIIGRKLVRRSIKDLNNTMNQLDLGDIFHSTKQQQITLFSNVHRTFSNRDIMPSQKTNKFKGIEIITKYIRRPQ